MSIIASWFRAVTSSRAQFVFADLYPQFVLSDPGPKLHLPYRGIFIRKRSFFQFYYLAYNSFLMIMVDANETKINFK